MIKSYRVLVDDSDTALNVIMSGNFVSYSLQYKVMLSSFPRDLDTYHRVGVKLHSLLVLGPVLLNVDINRHLLAGDKSNDEADKEASLHFYLYD